MTICNIQAATRYAWVIVNICVALAVRMSAKARRQRRRNARWHVNASNNFRAHTLINECVCMRALYALKICCLLLIAELLLMRKHRGWLILPLPLNAARALMMRAFICIPHQRRLNGKAYAAVACGLREFTFQFTKKKKNTKPTTYVVQVTTAPPSQPAQATVRPPNTFPH